LRVDWALPCRYAEVAIGETATIVGAGLETLGVVELPADVHTFVALKLAAPPDELAEQHELHVAVVGPELEEHEVLSAALDTSFARRGPCQPGLEIGLLLVISIQWIAVHLGLHTVEIHVDARRQRSIPLVLREATAA
jgi:hypothetical protein